MPSTSADGSFRAELECGDTVCGLTLVDAQGGTRALETSVARDLVAWAPDRNVIAWGVGAPGGSASAIVVVDEGATEPRTIFESEGIGALAWYGDDLIVSAADGAGASVYRVALDGTSRAIATAARAIQYFHAAPAGSVFAFTQISDEGWRMMTLDVETGVVTDLGAMGSDGPGGAPVVVPPEQKGPMAIVWSPDGARLAFGGGFEPPYVMTTVDIRTGSVAKTPLPDGYPGEIRWSPDSARIAVSTYDAERSHHETLVVDPSTGAARHLLSGCVIVWSHDSRFLAVHGETEPGIAIVDVETGALGRLTAESHHLPLEWQSQPEQPAP
jgi:hypothetical protein